MPGEQRGDRLVPLGDLASHGTAQLACFPVRFRATSGYPASCLPASSQPGHPFACAQPSGCSHTAGYQRNCNLSFHLAVSRWIEAQAGWSIRKLVKTARRYRTIEIQSGRQTITAAGPLPDHLWQVLETINRDN
jgi:hypothetical protein